MKIDQLAHETDAIFKNWWFENKILQNFYFYNAFSMLWAPFKNHEKCTNFPYSFNNINESFDWTGFKKPVKLFKSCKDSEKSVFVEWNSISYEMTNFIISLTKCSSNIYETEK